MFHRNEARCLATELMPLLLGAVLMVAVPGGARADNVAGARNFLAALTSQAIDQLADTSISVDERKRKFRLLFTENFDIPTIGRFVLGRYWRPTSEAVRQDFIKVFEEVMVERFAPEFANRTRSHYKIGAVRNTSRADQFIVGTKIAITKERIVRVDWRIRLRGGRFHVLDITSEGVSMALTFRSEYASVIKNSPDKVEGLILLLRQRIKGREKPETSSAAK